MWLCLSLVGYRQGMLYYEGRPGTDPRYILHVLQLSPDSCVLLLYLWLGSYIG